MKILQLVQKPQRRGAEVFAEGLSSALREQGHAVSTLYLYPHSGSGQLPLLDQDKILDGKIAHPFEKLLGFHPALLARLNEQIREFEPDIVQSNGARTVKYGALSRGQGQGRRWALVYRNIGSPRSWQRSPIRRQFYERLVLPRLDGVVGVSKATLEELRASLQASTRTVHIANGVDLNSLDRGRSRQKVRRELGIDDSAPILLFMGSFTAEKRPEMFLEILDEVRSRCPKAQGWMVGEGPLFERTREAARSRGLADHVDFFGSRDEPADFMNAADVLVLPSTTEGIPAVALESGTLALPVVASKVGGLPECVQEGRTGFLVPPDQLSSWRERIVALLNNDELRAEVGTNASNWCRSQFSVRRIAGSYLDFYKSLHSRSPAA